MKNLFGAVFVVFVLTLSAVAQSMTPNLKAPPDLERFLQSADKFTLYSLNPFDFKNKATNKFRNYEILGQINIEQGAERTKLVKALSDGIKKGGGMADCFDPRHGIRALGHGITMDFLICFQCGRIEAYSNNGTNWVFGVSSTPAAIFNEVLKQAHVPLPAN